MMEKMFSSIADLHDLLIEAAETERRLPPALRRQKLASWPDYQHDWLSYASEKTATSLARATAKQISRYENLLGAVCSMQTSEDRRLIWATAHSGAFRQRGVAWTKLARQRQMHRQTVKDHYQQALCRLYYSVKFD